MRKEYVNLNVQPTHVPGADRMRQKEQKKQNKRPNEKELGNLVYFFGFYSFRFRIIENVKV